MKTSHAPPSISGARLRAGISSEHRNTVLRRPPYIRRFGPAQRSSTRARVRTHSRISKSIILRATYALPAAATSSRPLRHVPIPSHLAPTDPETCPTSLQTPSIQSSPHAQAEGRRAPPHAPMRSCPSYSHPLRFALAVPSSASPSVPTPSCLRGRRMPSRACVFLRGAGRVAQGCGGACVRAACAGGSSAHGDGRGRECVFLTVDAGAGIIVGPDLDSTDMCSREVGRTRRGTEEETEIRAAGMGIGTGRVVE
ncbi:hypothetical protein B0H17DRAFT_589301 [Mycena rosella]|uniref:Uncharacterized protein n=1 Tax=Mycena rosella TaxID=1033263 RepID=A0AAD7DG13_MYCRO|nr:hypothetical protein B0H17DRAFT_589301 [Mycena rosella]